MSNLMMSETQEKTVRDWLRRNEAGGEAQLVQSVLLPDYSEGQRHMAVFIDGGWKIMEFVEDTSKTEAPK